jgi:uncharacterized surface anchored protein
MHKSALLCLVILITFGLLASAAGAVNVNGTKFYDYDQNGIYDNADFPLENWNISLFWLNGTAVPGMNNITGVDGIYNITGINPYFNYTVCEELKTGWTNTTPLCYPINFTICGDGGPEFFANTSDMNDFMPNLINMSSQALLLYNARIGDAVSETGGEDELKIAYPLGQWNPGQSSSALSPSGELDWTNDTYESFNATWTPGVTLYENASWTIDNVTVDQDDTNERTEAVPIRDIVIRLHSEDEDYFVELNNLSIHQGPYTYNLVNNHILFNGSTDANNQDLYLVFRASNALTAQGGQDIGSGGFSFTGDIRFTWPQGPPNPDMNNIKMDIIVGRYDCDFIDTQTRDFGNFIEGNISGYKLDNNGTGLQNWNITLTNTTSGTLQNFTFTGFDGNYSILNVPFGTYYLNETPQCGWIQLFGNYTVTINATNTTFTNQNFTNQQVLGTINVTKYNDLNGNGQRDAGEQGVKNWLINLSYSGNGTLYQSSQTDTSGNLTFIDVPWGTYNLTEEVRNGWTRTEPVANHYIVEVNCTNLNTTFLFGNHQNKIFGYKLDNQTGQGIANWTINLYNNGNGNPLDNTTTNGSGYYEFAGGYIRPNRVYLVNETLQPGYVLISPLSGQYVVLNLNETHLDEGPLNFTNTRLNGSISGYKLDQFGDPIQNWPINLTNQSGAPMGSMTTGPDGGYNFTNLAWDSYNVSEGSLPGYILGIPTFNNTLQVNGTNLNLGPVNFTNTRLNGSINGYKLDQFGDPIQNWPVNLTNLSGSPIGNNLTDENGFFNFTDLAWDSYNVSEGILAGYIPVGPTFNDTLIVNGTNLNLGPVNFTNMVEEFCIDGYKIDNCTGEGLKGWNITIMNETDTVVGNATTDDDGHYQFCNLIPGDYTICEDLKPGWANLTPLCIQVDLTANTSNVNFTNTQVFCIEGRKEIGTTGIGLADWNITVKDETDAVVGNATTNETGYYQVCGLIPGDYTVCEELQSGWVNQTPLCQNVTLPCANLTVNFINVPEEFCIDGYKIDNCTGRGFPGWNISVMDESQVEVGNATTDGSGHYEVCGLLPGNYTVCEELKTGFANLTPSCIDVQIDDDDVSNINFTNTQEFCIEGYKLDEGTDEGLQGWNITITDDQDQEVGTATTDENGFYQVCNLIPGDYTVCEELQSGWVNISPICQNVTLPCNNLTVNFTNMQEEFCIDGYKIDNCTGEGLPGWIITVEDESEVVYGNAITNETGYYQVCNLTPGSYMVCEELQDGWMNLTPSCVDVEVINEEVNDINFTNTRQFCIEGYKLDTQTGEGLPDWDITVTDDLHQEVGTATTDVNGFYKVCDLIPGNYTVCEELQPGWVNISPLCQEVTLPCENLTVNFTNMQQEGEKFCIDGYKIDNCTGLGLEGWTISVRNESDVVVGSGTTDQDGFYQVCDLIPGNFTVCEMMQPGWMNLTPFCVDTEIIDADVHDINFTNAQQVCIEGYKLDGQTGLGQSGWNISVMDESDVVLASTVTDQDGFYQVCGLIPGNYIVCEELQSGWVNITPICQEVTLPCENLTVNFTNIQQGGEKFCIDGYKIDNCTGEGLEGWNITVKDESDTEVGTATTDENGFYQICNLIPGEYTVCEELQNEWVNLTPLCMDVQIVDADVNDVNFTNTQQFCIEGHKILAENGLGQPGWNISVMEESGQEVGTATTDENGFYQICGLIPGNYTVCEELQPGFVNLTPLCQNVTLSCENLTVDLVNDPAVCIEGYKIDNCSGLGVPDWRISVIDESGAPVGSATTDQNGFYQVCGLIAGNYTVCEELQPGWMNLTPLCIDVILTDINVNNVNFTNTQQFCINGYKIDEQTGLGLPGWNISVMDESGENLGTAITDQNGFYQVCGLIPGNYTVCEETQPGWINLTPSCVDVTLPCNDLTVNFTNLQTFGQICGWVGANCNFGEISPPDVRVRFALNASDLTVPGKYFETTTDIRGVYCISGLPTGQPLFGIALSPLAFPDRYLERPISYQIDSGKLITCEDSACTPQIPPLANNGTLQVNWVLTNNQAFFNPMPL